jgi:hypothetical protein
MTISIKKNSVISDTDSNIRGRTDNKKTGYRKRAKGTEEEEEKEFNLRLSSPECDSE